MKKHVIIAPHADDEIIGCYSILNSGEVNTVAFPFQNKLAFNEVAFCQEMFDFTVNGFTSFEEILNLAKRARMKKGLIFFPDPTYELHPTHRIIGAMGERLVKVNHFDNVVFYTTNMNAPYVQEVSKKEVGNKHRTLNDCYPEKASLWKYDHKYFLFEGYCRYGHPLSI